MIDPLPPVIILASRESGGSAFSALLGAHPEFCVAPHLNALAFEAYWQLAEYSRKPRDPNLHGLLRFVAEQVTGEQTIQSVKTALRWLHSRAELPVAEFYAALNSLVMPRRLVDFSPLYAQNAAVAARVVAAQPAAKFVHLVRDPLAQALVLSRSVSQSLVTSIEYWPHRGSHQPCIDMWEIGEQFVDWSTTPAVFDPQFAWFRSQSAIVAATADLPAERVMRLRFEKLQADPPGTLHEVFGWLGIALSDQRVESMLASGSSPYASVGPYSAPFGVDLEIVGRTIGEMLETAPQGDAVIDPHAPLPWRGDGEALLPEVASLAEALGYEVMA